MAWGAAQTTRPGCVNLGVALSFKSRGAIPNELKIDPNQGSATNFPVKESLGTTEKIKNLSVG
jgi:hypothetical protein